MKATTGMDISDKSDTKEKIKVAQAQIGDSSAQKGGGSDVKSESRKEKK